MQSVPFYLTSPPIRIRCCYTRSYISSCKVPVIYKISTKHETAAKILGKTSLIQKFTKIRPVRAELFQRTDRPTNRRIWQSCHSFLATGLRTRPWTDRGSRLCGCEVDRTVKRRESHGEILWWKRWTFWSHKRSTSLSQQNNHKLLKFCPQITHTPYNKGALSQPDAFRTCLDFWFCNQLTGKARHSSQEQLNLLTWNKTQKR